jgi:curved DNA-binding protein
MNDFFSQWGGSPGGGRRMSQEEFAQMFGGAGGGSGFSDFFETLFGGGMGGYGGGFQQRSMSRRGQDVEHTVQLSLEEAFSGTTRDHCSGKTAVPSKLKSPPASKPAPKSASPGKDSQVSAAAGREICICCGDCAARPFRTAGDNLRMEFPVDLYTALLGGKAEVRGIDRTVQLTIPPETANGKTFRLRGLGMPNLKNPKNGEIC